MKFLIISLISLFVFTANANTFTCEGQVLREGALVPVNSLLHLTIKTKNGNTYIKKMLGHVHLGNYQSKLGDKDAFDQESYYGVFTVENKDYNRNYNPRVYKGYTQFPNIDAAMTINSEGYMGGEFVINLSDKDAKEVKAHYVFQAGDHRGGTIDYKCQKTLNLIY